MRTRTTEGPGASRRSHRSTNVKGRLRTFETLVHIEVHREPESILPNHYVRCKRGFAGRKSKSAISTWSGFAFSFFNSTDQARDEKCRRCGYAAHNHRLQAASQGTNSREMSLNRAEDKQRQERDSYR
jgi:hypothetical protein